MEPSQSQEIFTNNQKRNTLSKLIEECSNESDIDKKIQLFYNLNSMLLISYNLQSCNGESNCLLKILSVIVRLSILCWHRS